MKKKQLVILLAVALIVVVAFVAIIAFTQKDPGSAQVTPGPTEPAGNTTPTTAPTTTTASTPLVAGYAAFSQKFSPILRNHGL